MTDRPDPFDDLEFETAEAVDAEVAIPQTVVDTPAPAPAPAAAKPDTKNSVETPTPATAPQGPSKLVAYATLAASALAFAGTVSVVVVTVATAKPEPAPISPERATLGRIEALLNGQQRRLDHFAAAAAAPGAPAGSGDLAALTAVVRANQTAIEQLPAMMKAQLPRTGSTVRQIVVTKPAGTSDPRVAEVLKAQAGIQRQIEALAARMAKTTAACVTQNDGQIRYP